VTRDLIVDVLVGGAVAAELICCAGVLAMRSAINRLHYAAAAGTVGPALVAAAVCVREGFVSAQGLNSVLIAVLLAVGGAALAGATARVIRLRERGSLEPTPAERERGA
jgi:multisubunit Na+/H+ antiporter MnhG subunit